jgi:2-keto-4-pentenoate hydratase/2-oxohepta-3-ene-1,7-dioic acid hydratase in catechol pathway
VLAAEPGFDPQNLSMELRVNDEVKQSGYTGQMVFSVAAIIEFISNMVTLEPGDLISTGTPAGVGAAKGTFLKPGDVMCGTIARIGTLLTNVTAERV